MRNMNHFGNIFFWIAMKGIFLRTTWTYENDENESSSKYKCVRRVTVSFAVQIAFLMLHMNRFISTQTYSAAKTHSSSVFICFILNCGWKYSWVLNLNQNFNQYPSRIYYLFIRKFSQTEEYWHWRPTNGWKLKYDTKCDRLIIVGEETYEIFESFQMFSQNLKFKNSKNCSNLSTMIIMKDSLLPEIKTNGNRTCFDSIQCLLC